jgi:hypothetical protein
MMLFGKSLSGGHVGAAALIGAVIVSSCLAQGSAVEPNSVYAGILKTAVIEANKKRPRVGPAYATAGTRPSGRFASISDRPRPIKELGDPCAVPVLIDIAVNGPEWEDTGPALRYLGRLSAVKTLGAHQDPRAFEPLLELMREGDLLEDINDNPQVAQLNIRGYAAEALGYLADKRAFEPLVEAYTSDPNDSHVQTAVVLALGFLEDPRATDFLLTILTDKQSEENLRYLSRRSLARIRDMRAIVPMIEQAEETGNDCALHDELMLMTRARIKLNYSREDRTFTASDFPELGKVDSPAKIWRHWLKVAKGRAECAVNQKDSDMAKWGVAALPFMIQRIKGGDGNQTDFIRRMSELTGHELRRNATPQECLAWWDNNKDKWTIPWVRP